MLRNRSVLCLIVLAGLVGGCGSDDGGGSGGGAQNGGEPIKIGASLPLTGEFSEPGKAAQQGYKVWEATINEQGGLLGRQVKFVFRDDASDQNTVVSDYTSLISRDKVDLLAGTFSSLLNIPASTVAEPLEQEVGGRHPELVVRDPHGRERGPDPRAPVHVVEADHGDVPRTVQPGLAQRVDASEREEVVRGEGGGEAGPAREQLPA